MECNYLQIFTNNNTLECIVNRRERITKISDESNSLMEHGWSFLSYLNIEQDVNRYDFFYTDEVGLDFIGRINKDCFEDSFELVDQYVVDYLVSMLRDSKIRGVFDLDLGDSKFYPNDSKFRTQYRLWEDWNIPNRNGYPTTPSIIDAKTSWNIQ